MEMQGIKRMRGSKAEGFREQQNVNAKERQRGKREVWMGLDEKGENGMGRRERSEEEKETCKVTVAQTQKRE